MSGLRVTYSVHFKIDLQAIPDGAREQIRRAMQQIAGEVSTVSESSPFWGSMRDSLLQIDVGDWRAVYRVDPGQGEILVVELQQIPS